MPGFTSLMCRTLETRFPFWCSLPCACGAPFSTPMWRWRLAANTHTQSNHRRHYHPNRVFGWLSCFALSSSVLCNFCSLYVIWNGFEPSFAVIANCIVAHNRIDCTKCNKEFVPISYRHPCSSAAAIPFASSSSSASSSSPDLARSVCGCARLSLCWFCYFHIRLHYFSITVIQWVVCSIACHSIFCCARLSFSPKQRAWEMRARTATQNVNDQFRYDTDRPKKRARTQIVKHTIKTTKKKYTYLLLSPRRSTGVCIDWALKIWEKYMEMQSIYECDEHACALRVCWIWISGSLAHNAHSIFVLRKTQLLRVRHVHMSFALTSSHPMTLVGIMPMRTKNRNRNETKNMRRKKSSIIRRKCSMRIFVIPLSIDRKC